MNGICGLQKMTLLDYPGRVACTVFLGGCDLRCPFCHNYELVEHPAQQMTEEELFSFLKKRQGLLDGVAVTGGEPCLHADLPAFLTGIRALGFPVKLDTNGFHPDVLREVFKEHLADYVAMDIKNSPEKYAETAGVPDPDLQALHESIRLIMEQAPSYEFRTTVVREFHEEADFHRIGEMIRGAQQYFLQAFTDRETVPRAGLHSPDPDEMRRYVEIASAYVCDARLRGVE